MIAVDCYVLASQNCNTGNFQLKNGPFFFYHVFTPKVAARKKNNFGFFVFLKVVCIPRYGSRKVRENLLFLVVFSDHFIFFKLLSYLANYCDTFWQKRAILVVGYFASLKGVSYNIVDIRNISYLRVWSLFFEIYL